MNLTEVSSMRPAVARSLGCHTRGTLEPHADPSDPNTLADGVRERMGKEPPPCTVDEAKFLLGLRTYTLKWIRTRGIQRLSWDADTDFETWLSMTHYPEYRKEALRKYKDEITDLLATNNHGALIRFQISLFMKDEFYTKYNQARGIYARSDDAKITFGPWFKMIETIIYQEPEFIKHVPVRDRPAYIYNMLFGPGASYVATDYSRYERHFTAKIMENCEFVLYDYMLGSVQGGAEVLELMREVLTGQNVIYNKYLSAKINARRMSGEMNTSLGNGFSNLMFMGYVCEQMGLGVCGVVEGDDGLFAFTGRQPSTKDFSQYGFDIKLEVYNEISKASFCGNLFDETDKSIITDPYDVLSIFGWTTARYLKSKRNKLNLLLKSKALSLAHQYPGCPILGSLAQYALRVTRSYDISGFNKNRRDICQWERDSNQEAINYRNRIGRDEGLYQAPGMGTRLLFEELYDINVSTQLMIEEYLDGLDSLQVLDIPLVSNYVPSDWDHYYRSYVNEYDIDSIPTWDNLPIPNLRV